MSMGTLPRGVWDAMDAHERTMPRDVESGEMISAVSAPAEVGEGSWPLDSWPVEGPYGQSGDLLWRGGGETFHGPWRSSAISSPHLGSCQMANGASPG